MCLHYKDRPNLVWPISPPTHNPLAIFGMVKDADNIYYCTKNQMRGFCVGGDMVRLDLVCLAMQAHMRHTQNKGIEENYVIIN